MLATLPLSIPIAASVTACATVVGTACSALTTSQSILYLRDRSMHEQVDILINKLHTFKV